jgi:solute carrier family 25 carnitine/acylcarnitine transporter 20/29
MQNEIVASSLMGVTKQIYAKAGLRGLYKGLGVTLMRETPGYGAYFASYTLLTHWLLPNVQDHDQASAALLFSGGFAGIMGWLVTYPADVVKTRLQSCIDIYNLVSEFQNPKYRTARHAFKLILKEEGYSVFFRGMGATILRAFPTNAATFYVFVYGKSLLV